VDIVDASFVAAFGSPFSVTPLPVSSVPVGWGNISHCQQGIESCLIKRCICIRQLMNAADGGHHITRWRNTGFVLEHPCICRNLLIYYCSR
jgi:hypothetical protein